MNDWVQSSIQLPEYPRGIHLITDHVLDSMPEIGTCKVGVLNIFIQHTSASISINENASPAVRSDLSQFLDLLIPDGYSKFKHVEEGPDDMPAHVKAALIGGSISLPVSDGRLALGTWQGIYLCEHRNRGGRRSIVATLSGGWESV